MVLRRSTVNIAFRSGRFVFSLALVCLIVLFGVAGPLLSGLNPNDSVGGVYESPSVNLPLGTDNFGHNELAQLMYGTRTSLEIGTLAGIIAVLLGLIIGTVSGFYGGLVEEVLMGITNVLITIPPIVVLVLLSIALHTRSTLTMGLIIGVTSWPWTARAIRAQASSIKAREHIAIARLSGEGPWGMILWEILPYLLSYVVMAFALQLSSGILTEAALSMLGLGPSNAISLGVLLHWSLLWEAVRQGVWWAFVPPTFFLAVISFGLLLLNSSLDEIYNPRLRRS